MGLFKWLKLKPRLKCQEAKIQRRIDKIHKGDFDKKALLNIIRDPKEPNAVRAEAVAGLADDRLLAEMTFDPSLKFIRQNIIHAISSLDTLRHLRSKGCSELIALNYRIDKLESDEYKRLDDETLVQQILQQKADLNIRVAIGCIRSPKPLAALLAALSERGIKIGHDHAEGLRKALRGIGLTELLPHLNHPHDFHLLADILRDPRDLDLLYHRIADCGLAEDFLKSRHVQVKKYCLLLLKHIESRAALVGLATGACSSESRLWAFTLLKPELKSNRELQQSLFDLVIGQKKEADPDIESLFKQLGKTLNYDYTEARLDKSCEACNGTGRTPYLDYGDPCDICRGTGRETETVKTLNAVQIVDI